MIALGDIIHEVRPGRYEVYRTVQWISNVISDIIVKCYKVGKNNQWSQFFSTGHLGDPNDSKSIGNQLLCYQGIPSRNNPPF